MATQKTIYELGLHDILSINGDAYVQRVPGGWIYWDGDGNAAVFIPFNDEFMGAIVQKGGAK